MAEGSRHRSSTPDNRPPKNFKTKEPEPVRDPTDKTTKIGHDKERPQNSTPKDAEDHYPLKLTTIIHIARILRHALIDDFSSASSLKTRKDAQAVSKYWLNAVERFWTEKGKAIPQSILRKQRTDAGARDGSKTSTGKALRVLTGFITRIAANPESFRMSMVEEIYVFVKTELEHMEISTRRLERRVARDSRSKTRDSRGERQANEKGRHGHRRRKRRSESAQRRHVAQCTKAHHHHRRRPDDELRDDSRPLQQPVRNDGFGLEAHASNEQTPLNAHGMNSHPKTPEENSNQQHYEGLDASYYNGMPFDKSVHGSERSSRRATREPDAASNRSDKDGPSAQRDFVSGSDKAHSKDHGRSENGTPTPNPLVDHRSHQSARSHRSESTALPSKSKKESQYTPSETSVKGVPIPNTFADHRSHQSARSRRSESTALPPKSKKTSQSTNSGTKEHKPKFPISDNFDDTSSIASSRQSTRTSILQDDGPRGGFPSPHDAVPDIGDDPLPGHFQRSRTAHSMRSNDTSFVSRTESSRLSMPSRSSASGHESHHRSYDDSHRGSASRTESSHRSVPSRSSASGRESHPGHEYHPRSHRSSHHGSVSQTESSHRSVPSRSSASGHESAMRSHHPSNHGFASQTGSQAGSVPSRSSASEHESHHQSYRSAHRGRKPSLETIASESAGESQLERSSQPATFSTRHENVSDKQGHASDERSRQSSRYDKGSRKDPSISERRAHPAHPIRSSRNAPAESHKSASSTTSSEYSSESSTASTQPKNPHRFSKHDSTAATVGHTQSQTGDVADEDEKVSEVDYAGMKREFLKPRKCHHIGSDISTCYSRLQSDDEAEGFYADENGNLRHPLENEGFHLDSRGNLRPNEPAKK